jgi:SAM-dependent methyltransferase
MTTGEEYVRTITRSESDRRARTAFQNLVLKVATPGACIFDFGCGPGLDARFYARQGFKVVAFDVDERMCATFAEYCKAEMESGQIELFQGDYRYFLDTLIPILRARFDISLVTSNFAPLNMIADLRELFAGFQALTPPGARVLASVLHPYFIEDMRYRWWWKNRHRSCYVLPYMVGMVYRRTPENFASQAAPHFALQAAVRGLPRRADARLKRASSLTLATARFTFLLFAKN